MFIKFKTIHGEEQTINKNQIVGFKMYETIHGNQFVSIQYTGGLLTSEITIEQYHQILLYLKSTGQLIEL